MKKLLFIPLAASLALFSCKKEQKDQVKNVDGYVNQEKDNQYRSQHGTLKATIQGKIDSSLSQYKGLPYIFNDKNFTFVQDNLKNIDGINGHNQMTTQLTNYIDTSGVEQKYKTEAYNIRMYEFEGSDYDNVGVDNYVNLSFEIYSGKIPADMLAQGYKTGVPQKITVHYSLVYIPQENAITSFNIDESIYYSYAIPDINGGYSEKKEELVKISGWQFDPSNGKVLFQYSAKDTDKDTKPSISGSVDTFILNNTILTED